MRFLVTGASGFIGKRFLQSLKKKYGEEYAIGTYNSHTQPGLEFLDMADRKAVLGFFERKRPEVVIHCAAIPGVNFCEQNQKKAWEINFLGTKNIVDACSKADSKIVFMSTNYVFDGKKGNYSENDKVKPLNYYGKLKLMCENYIKSKLKNYLILRTTNVFGYDIASKNFVMATIDALSKGQQVRVAIDQDGNPTHVDDLVKSGIGLLEKKQNGIFNAVGPDCLNRLEWAKIIADTFGLDSRKIIGLPTEFLLESAPRPLKAGLSTSKIKKACSTKFMDSLQSMQYMKKEMLHGRGMKKVSKTSQPYETKESKPARKIIRTKIAILGGGLAGLAVAYHLEQKGTTDYLLIEKSARPGGLNSTQKSNGFLMDHGPHLFFTQDKYVVELMQKLLGDNIGIRQSDPWQFSYGRYIKYPYTVNLRFLPKKVRDSCIADFKLAWQGKMLDRQKGKNPVPGNYKDWCYYHYGKSFSELFLFKYCRKYWTVEPEKLTTEWIGSKLYLPSQDEVLSGAGSQKQGKKRNFYYYSSYRYPLKNGSGALTDAFLGSVDKPRLLLNSAVISVDEENRTILMQDGTSVPYDTLVNSLPMPSFVPMLAKAPGAVRIAAKNLAWTSVICVLVGIDRKDISNRSWIYFDDPKTSFFRLSFPLHFSPYACPEGTSSVWAEVVYSKNKPIDRDKIFSDVLRDLKKHGFVKDNDKIVAFDFADSHYAYPVYDRQWKKSVGTITRYLESNNIRACGRFGKWEYMWTYQVILDAKETAERISRKN